MESAGAVSRPELADGCTPGRPQTFTFTADLDPAQQAARGALAGDDLCVLIAT